MQSNSTLAICLERSSKKRYLNIANACATRTSMRLDALVSLGAAELQDVATDAVMKHLAEAILRSRGRRKLYPAARSALCWFVERA